MSKWLTSLIAASVALSAPLQANAAGGAPPTCYPDWSSASLVVRSEMLTPVRQLHDQVRSHLLGDLMRITLCVDDGRYVYRLLVRDRSGNIAPVMVDARKPF